MEAAVIERRKAVKISKVQFYLSFPGETIWPGIT